MKANFSHLILKCFFRQWERYREKWTKIDMGKRETQMVYNGKEMTMVGKRETDQSEIDQIMPRSPYDWVALLRVVIWWLDRWLVGAMVLAVVWLSSLVVEDWWMDGAMVFAAVCSSVTDGWARGRPGGLLAVLSKGSDGSCGSGGSGFLMALRIRVS